MPLLPVALYGLEVPAGDILTPAIPDFPATFRITMAAIDPSASTDIDAANGTHGARATLKLVRQPMSPDDDDSDDSDDDEYMRALLGGGDSDEDDEDEDEDEEANGGPSDPSKSRKARKQAAVEQLLASIAKDSDEDMEDALNGINGATKSKKKGKAKAIGDEEDDEDVDEEDDDDEDEDEDDELEVEEFVLCTLDPEKTYQQVLDITIGEDERVFFKVSGTHTIYLTGNYVIPDEDTNNSHRRIYESEEDDEYDLSPDEDELEMDMEDDESDELDDIADPRVVEVDTEEDEDEEVEEEEEVPQLVSKVEKKGKNKRVAEELERESLDDLMAKSLKPEPTAKDEVKLSKKQLKKLKNNNGNAVGTKSDESKADTAVKESPASVKSDKKVQFAKNLEQGPSGSSADAKKDSTKKDNGKDASRDAKLKASLGVKTIKGVKIDDKKLGSGPAAKNGDRVGMRYIGKLIDGKVFDSNKKGKPFQFKLGVSEVIQGWDIGVQGMSVGGERRLTIPASLAYGSKSLPGIPANSTLIFDVKLLEIK